MRTREALRIGFLIALSLGGGKLKILKLNRKLLKWTTVVENKAFAQIMIDRYRPLSKKCVKKKTSPELHLVCTEAQDIRCTCLTNLFQHRGLQMGNDTPTLYCPIFSI